MKIINFGSMNMDNIYHVKTIVKPGETIASTGIEACCGGKGLNQSVALARAGMDVKHAGMVGSDEAGEELLQMLSGAEVDITLVKKTTGKSGHTIIQVDEKGQNSIILFGGANQEITKDYVDMVLDQMEKDDLLLLQNEISKLPYLIDQAVEKNLRIIFNPSPMEESLKDLDFGKFDLLFINEVEGEQLTGSADPKEILNYFSERYPKTAIVLTLGAMGAYFQKGDEIHFQAAKKVQAVDTTGAGDTFTGYFVKEYYQTLDAAKALSLATKASAIAVTRMGAAKGVPLAEEVISL